MAYTVILHIQNEDPLLAEMDELPKPADMFVMVSNIRKRDGSRVNNIDMEAERFMYPWTRVNFIEVLASEAERAKVMKFFRE
jgi:hypothetical protein